MYNTSYKLPPSGATKAGYTLSRQNGPYFSGEGESLKQNSTKSFRGHSVAFASTKSSAWISRVLFDARANAP
jgi:hypothetical protein